MKTFYGAMVEFILKALFRFCLEGHQILKASIRKKIKRASFEWVVLGNELK
jgi:hypothetical protein